MSTTIESLELEIQSNATSAVSGIEALSNSLVKLKNSVKGGLGLGSIVSQIQGLNNSLNSIDGSSVSKIYRLANSLNSLGKIKVSATIGNQLKNIGNSLSSLNGSDFSGIEKLSNSLQPLNTIGNSCGLKSTITQLKKIPELANTLSKMNWSDFTSQMQMLSNSLSPLASKLNTVSNSFGKLPSNINKTISATNKIAPVNNNAKRSYTELLSKVYIFKNIIDFSMRHIANWITQSNKYIENLNLFNASISKYAEEAYNYSEKVGELMGIDPGEWMRHQGVFMTITEGFGVASDRAYIMSKNLTQLGYDLSSFFNIPYEDSMQKLTSGISGELEPLRRLGYDLSQARLQAIALSLGIDRAITSMTQAEKAQLRYYAIMTQVTKAQGDMARTLNAPANQLRVLQAQINQCARALGNIFIPALNIVLPYIIAFTKVIRLLANSVAALFGFKLPEVDYSSLTDGAKAMGDIADGADDAKKGLGKAAKEAKKVKNALLGIDELNIISPEEDDKGKTGGAGGIGDGSDLGFELPEYDFLKGLVDSRVDEIVKKIKGALTEIEAVIATFALAIGTILVVTGANIPIGLALMALGAAGLISAIVSNWGEMTERLAKVLTVLTAIIGGFLLAIGAILVFSGVNVPLGIALMVAGALAIATAVTINWKYLNGNIKNALSILTGIVGGALLALGALLAFTGTNVPLGIALMVAGAITIATAVALNWDSLSTPIKKAVGTIETIVSGALIAFGAILAFTAPTPAAKAMGIALMAAGAVGIVSAVALNWDSLTGDLKQSLNTVVQLVSGALIGVGAVLAFSGINLALGVAMIAAGAAGIVGTAKGLDWNSLLGKIKTVLKEIGFSAGLSLMGIGLILALTGVAIPIGIALIAMGAVSFVSSVALNWGSICGYITKTLKDIGIIAGVSLLALGVILCLSGVGIPLGIALIAAGATGLVSGIALNWGDISKNVSKGLKDISNKFDGFKKDVSKKLDGAKNAILEWSNNVNEYFTKGKDGKNLGDNLKEAATTWGKKLKEGITSKFTDANTWINEKISTPLSNAIKTSPPVEFTVKLKNTASTWWQNTKLWWEENSKEGLSLETGIKLVKSGWETIKGWVGQIPILSQGISLIKQGWSNVRSWVGYIPVLSQGITLIKKGWSTIKGWIGYITTLSQSISLIKQGWTTIKNWIGYIPTLSQSIALIKYGWSTVKGWIGNIPIISQGISLIKSGWSTVANWINTKVVPIGISLFRDGWKSLSSFIGERVSVGISLFKDGWNSLKGFFGLSSGGYNSGHGFKLFEQGGYINSRGVSGFWDSIPKYANGTANAGLHGTMFIAGEAGTEMVGHLNGQTEVLNKSQITQAMKAATISGMLQFTGYFRSINNNIINGTNAVIRSILVSSDILTKAVSTTNVGYPTHLMTKSIYSEIQSNHNNNSTDENTIKLIKEFYRDYVEPTLKEIASDTKRQADKEETTIVKIGNRTIKDAVVTQENADGYSFV